MLDKILKGKVKFNFKEVIPNTEPEFYILDHEVHLTTPRLFF